MKAEVLKPLLGAKGTVNAKIVSEPKMGKYGVDVAIEIAKQQFIVTLKETGRDYSQVAEILGQDPEDWVGHKLTLGIRSAEIKTGPRKGEKGEFVNVLGVQQAGTVPEVPRIEGGSVLIFPSAQTYHRLPLDEENSTGAGMRFKRVDVEDKDGNPLKIVFVRPTDTKR